MKSYVETTVLTDALLKPGSVRSKSARSALREFSESLLPVYAIKEMKAGPLHHYVWLHGKLVTTKSWKSTLEQIRRIGGSTWRIRWVTTALEALEADAHINEDQSLGELLKKYGSSAKHDLVMCDRARLSIHRIIRKAWKTRRMLTTAVVDELACYHEADLSEER